MALIHGSVPGTSAVRLVFSTSASPSRFCLNVPVVKQGWKNSCRRRVLRAMVQETVQGSPLVYAREMERLSAKESLLLAV
ncbi:putative plastid-lipid-associated protein 13 [Arabidopsis thaliana]